MTDRPISNIESVFAEPRSPRRGRFFWKLFLGNAILLTLVMGACLWSILSGLDRFHQAELISFLSSQASALRGVLAPQWDAATASHLDQFIKDRTGAEEGVRITLIGPNGMVWADSSADPATLDSHADRPEVVQARSEEWGASTRWSDSVHRELQYVALRVGPSDAPRGFVRVAMPLGVVHERTGAVHRLVWAIGLSGLAAAMLLTIGLAMLWGGRISRVTAAARGLSRGDLTTPVDTSGGDEVALLARALDRMRHRIASQVATIDGQRRSLESLLDQLSEGVVVVRRDGRVHWINAAARKLLSVPFDLVDPTVEHCFSQHDVQRMLLLPIGGAGGVEADARLDLAVGGTSVSLLARASDIHMPQVAASGSRVDDSDAVKGRLLVLTDVTELSKAIRLRTDFVANASHELRTPLAAMRGAAETLQKMNLAQEGDAAQRFVNMIARHVSRLEDLVGDLLSLSRVESPGASFEPTDLRIEKFLVELTEKWRDAADRKSVSLTWHVAPDCPQVRVSAHLLQLALDNLVDNAVKFSSEGGTVRVEVFREEERMIFRVTDRGCGIPPEDRERVFERFYQVARARSGTGSPTDQTRGTGLGLSIVRHAVTAMGGDIRLTSEIGEGTIVQIDVPAA